MHLGPYAIVDAGAFIGAGCWIEPFARIHGTVRLGRNCRVGQGAVLGGWPQIRDFDEADLGTCVIGDDCRIGEHVTVHAASRSDECTSISDGVFLMAAAHVGHDCELGSQAILANAVLLGGHVRIGSGAFLGGGCAIHQNCQVGELALVAGGIPVMQDVLPWSRAMGNPVAWGRLNLPALRRAGWTSQDMAEVSGLLNLVLESAVTLEQAIESLVRNPSPKAATLVRFLQRSRRGLVRPRS